MPVHSEIDTRMKEYYENRYRIKLTRRIPVIVRIDGRAFHTFTKGFNKPYDYNLIDVMQKTTNYLCSHIEGCVFGYTQSDEISLLLIDFKKLNSDAFFDYNVQKISSITTSMATLAFNKIFSAKILNYNINTKDLMKKTETDYKTTLLKAADRGAMFDARCFNIPKEEVCNYFYSRQIDAIRNSKQMAGHAYFSDKEIHKVSVNGIVEKLIQEKGIDWNDYPTAIQRGTAFYKSLMDYEYTDPKTLETNIVKRSFWRTDIECPLFNKDRNYIEQWLKTEEE